MLAKKRLIDLSNGEVSILGVTIRGSIGHAADMYRDAEPSTYEQASIALADMFIPKTSFAMPQHSVPRLSVRLKHRLLRCERALVRGPRLCPRDVGGEGWVFFQQPRAFQSTQHMHHDDVGRAKRAI